MQYKVVELSTVDEAALERTLNEWSAQGWNLDGIQFAMREASKRPAMAFVFFTREGEAQAAGPEAPSASRADARARLLRLSEREDGERLMPTPPPAVSAHERLRQLAGDDDDLPAPTLPSGFRELEPEE